MERGHVSLLRGQNYFQLSLTGGINNNPKLQLCTSAPAEWPHKMTKVPSNKQTQSQTAGICSDCEEVEVHSLVPCKGGKVSASVKALLISLYLT